jgi:hypothetical protein
MTDREQDHYELITGANEPSPEEPEARYDATPYVAEHLAEERELRQRLVSGVRGTNMILDEIRKLGR